MRVAPNSHKHRAIFLLSLGCVAAAFILGGCSGGSPPLDPPRPRSLACDGHTDVAPALQAMFDAGGVITIPRGICDVSHTLYITQSNTFLSGQGDGFAGDGSSQPATGLLWTGPRNGTLLVMGSKGHAVQGGGISRLGLESNHGLAAIGLEIDGVEGATFSAIAADAFNDAAIDLGPTRFNTMHNVIENFSLDNEINKGTGLRIGTIATNTAYYNDVQDAYVDFKYGAGIEFLASDGNLVTDTHEYEEVGGTGTGVLFGCNAISNHMVWLSAGYTAKNDKAVVVYGQNRCGYPHQSWANSIELYDQNDNGGPPPIVGNFTDFWCRNDAGKPCGQAKRHASDALETLMKGTSVP